MFKRAGIFVGCVMMGLWAATVLLMEKLSWPEHQVFLPWLWLEYFYRFGERFSPIFVQTSWPIYASMIVGVLSAWFSRLLDNRTHGSTAHGSARWARESEIADAGLLEENGVVLGKSITSNKLIRHDGPEHVLVIAPTRGGKGVGIVVPTLLTWPHSVVIFDPKGENWRITSGSRAKLNQCWYFDPTSPDTACFNPLMEIRSGYLEVKDTQNIADIIVDPDGRLETRNHWQNAAHSLLVGAILHLVHDYPRKSLAGVVELLARPGVDFEDTLKEMAASKHLVVQSVAQEMLNKHIEERSGVLSTAIAMLSIFRDPLVANATETHDFSISSLRDKPTSLYLVLPPSDLSRLRVLLRIMLNQIGRVLTEKETSNQRRILFLLDEFPALGRLEFFESALAYMAGYGLKALLICQSLNQLQKSYGERNSILDNCHVRVAFANNDDQTARRLSDLLGEQTLVKEQTSLSGGRFAMFKPSSSTAKIEFGRALLQPAEINRLPSDQEIILINGIYPILANKIRYYEDRQFTCQLPPTGPVLRKKKKPVLQTCVQASPTVEHEITVGSAL